jgi:hypothetical protein
MAGQTAREIVKRNRQGIGPSEAQPALTISTRKHRKSHPNRQPAKMRQHAPRIDDF